MKSRIWLLVGLLVGAALGLPVIRAQVGPGAPRFPGILSIASGKTLTASNTLTFTGTDSSTVAFGAGGTVLYSGGAVTSIATTSPISGGTITGTGTISLLVNTDFLFTASQSITKTVNATSADGLVLTNTMAAAAGAQQWSPRLRLTGQGWKTTATAASQAVDWVAETIPVQGAANPTSQLSFSSQVNGGGYTQRFFVTDSGVTNIIGSLLINAGGGGSRTLSVSSGRIVIDGGLDIAGTASWGNGWASLGGGGGSGNDVTIGALNARIVIAPSTLFTVEQRVGTNAQRNYLYNTFTTQDTAGEWWKSDWRGTANQFRMGAVAGSSSGTNRSASWDYGDKLASATAAITVPATSGNIVFGGGITVPGGTAFLTTNTALTDGAAASLGTLSNAPAAGNPTKWIAINDNGTTRYIPAW